MYSEDSRSTLRLLPHLDPAQVIILGWGRVLPWCWMTWRDPRIANAECITHLVRVEFSFQELRLTMIKTANWLFHLDLFLSAYMHESPDAWTGLLGVFIAKHSAAVTSAIVVSVFVDCHISSPAYENFLQHTLHHIVIALCTTQQHAVSQDLITVLVRCSWASARLLDPSSGGWRDGSHTVELARSLCTLFVILGHSVDEQQGEAVVRAKTLPRTYWLSLPSS
jgi:hypothetical protein